MKLNIDIAPVEHEYKSQLVVFIHLYYGDGDLYDTLKVGGFQKNCKVSYSHLEDLLLTLERMEKAYPNGKGSYETYDHVNGFNKWFVSNPDFESLLPLERIFYNNHWPVHPEAYDIQGTYDSYSVYYFDEYGQKFEVDVTLQT